MKYFTFQSRKSPQLKFLSEWLFSLVLLSTMTSALNLNPKDDGKKLELVQVLFRHGERTPQVEEYSKIPYTPPSVYDPYGLGQLTNNGRMQAFELGLLLRKRYANYLDDVYHAEDVYAYASDHERTMATMQLVLAGLYPPTKDFQWNPVLNWQPIPYIYTPGKFDVLLKPFHGQRFVEIQIRETADFVFAKIKEEYSDIVQHVKEFSKLSLSERLIVLCNVYNVLLTNERMNIPLPEWVTRDVLIRLKDYALFYLESLAYTPEMRRMHGGPLIKQFIKSMNVHETVETPRKIYLYSGHDANIVTVLRALGVEEFGCPDYSSAIIVEKLRDIENNRLYVRLIGRRGAGEEFKKLQLKNCSEFCPIEEFLMITKEVIPSDEEMHHMEKEFRGSLTNDLFLNDPYVTKR